MTVVQKALVGLIITAIAGCGTSYKWARHEYLTEVAVLDALKQEKQALLDRLANEEQRILLLDSKMREIWTMKRQSGLEQGNYEPRLALDEALLRILQSDTREAVAELDDHIKGQERIISRSRKQMLAKLSR
ncbi:MAG: hypothetical protein O3C40_08530 [Planctomycetota bacterium]|nr:hypothetical protein [Planctomycetota bacterium]